MDGDGPRSWRLEGSGYPPRGARKQVEVKGAVAGAETGHQGENECTLPLRSSDAAVLEQKARQRSRFHWR